MRLYQIFLFTILIFAAGSCANRAAGPTGGPKDSIPPVVVRSSPINGAVNFKKKDIQVYFNENITLDKVSENVVVSPPQKTQPIVRANAKVLSVSLQDELQDSTTYSILFGNAIVDLNERNPLENYVFSFATGDEIDSLQIAGRLLNAENLDPMSGVFVGIHDNLNDTAILGDQFKRIAKTDSEGKFTIQNIKNGQYKLYALSDLNRDFKYQPGESVAFYDSIIIPEVRLEQRIDTIWSDSVTVDTIHMFSQTVFTPDDILIKLFKETKKRQYLVKSERTDSKYFQLFFNDKQDILPQITPLNFDVDTRFLVQKSGQLDSLTYWIPDAAVYNQDTLTLTVEYLKTDSLFNYVSTVDTLNLFQRKPRQTSRGKSEEEVVEEQKPLNFKNNLSSSFDFYRDIVFSFEEPLDSFCVGKIHLFHKVDTITEPVEFTCLYKDSIGRILGLSHAWKPEESYELNIDSAAFVSIYGRVSNQLKSSFKIKSLEDYSTLKITLQNYDPNAYIQVIDSKEQVIQSKRAEQQGAVFQYLRPGEYFLRMFIDANQNDKWDTGDLERRIQPEEVIYFSKKLSLRANWELEETWNHTDPSFYNKKPEELIKTTKKR
ncbi:MAG TPA: Ig-like domain-containing domain [Paludibacter sp.]|nr:Ig-like domain-containing domain [Paludibacter sp.]HOS45838.1 Ig-like domain-containing domain [Paludibacter sp.]HPM11234.1 Ig-like domain-containing domain [Paludibacter sp.]